MTSLSTSRLNTLDNIPLAPLADDPEFKRIHGDAMSRGCRCDLCPLALKRQGPVPSSVIPNAQLTAVAEAPGKFEVLQKENLVGPSGRIFNLALQQGGLSRSSCSRLNTIACRPPPPIEYNDYIKQLKRDHEDAQQRHFEGVAPDPGRLILPEEACRPRLIRDIEESGSKVFLAIGNHALKSLAAYFDIPFGKRRKGQGSAIIAKTISDQHGAPITLSDGRILCSAIHPASAMRASGRSMMPVIKDDIARAARIAIRGYVDWQPPKSILFPTVEKIEEVCQRFVDNGSTVVADIETNGKDPLECQIRCIGLASVVDGEEIVIVVPIRYRQSNAEWWPDIDTKMRVVHAVRSVFSRCVVAGHNVVNFDSTVLLRYGLISDRNKVFHDTMLMAKSSELCELPRNLAFVSTRFLETIAWKIGHDDKFDPDSGAGTDEELHKYCGIDCANSLRIFYKLLDRLASLGTMTQYEIDIKLAPIFRDMGILGLCVDTRRRRNLAVILRDELKRRKQDLEDILLAFDKYRIKGEDRQKLQDFVDNGPPKKTKIKLTKAGKPSRAKVAKKRFNPNTPADISYFLFKVKRLIPLVNSRGRDFKDGDKVTASAAAMLRLLSNGVDKQTADFIDALFVYRAFEKLSSTYVGRIAAKDFKRSGKLVREGDLYGGFPMKEEDFGEPIGKLHILHTTYNLSKIASGRVSTRPAVQNWLERGRESRCYDCMGLGEDPTTPMFSRCELCEKLKKKKDAAWAGEIRHCTTCHARRCSHCKGRGKHFDKATEAYNEDLVCNACYADGLTRAPLNMRTMIMAPAGHCFVNADFAGLELRIYAAIANDRILLDLLKTDTDLHLFNYACLEANNLDDAWKLYREFEAQGGKKNPKIKYLRTVSKRVVFAILYGCEVSPDNKLYAVLSAERDKATGERVFPKVTEKDCVRWFQNWYATHPWTRPWQEKAKIQAERFGYVASYLDGRKRLFVGGAEKKNAPVNHGIQCVTESSLVLTDQGYQSIRTLLEVGTEGRRAWTGSAWAAFKVISKGTAPICKVTLKNQVVLEGLSQNHKVKVLRENDYAWVEVKDLKVGDQVCTARAMPMEFGTDTMPLESAYWLGYHIGNGTLSRDRELTFSIGNRFHAPLFDQVARLQTWAEDKFGDTVRLTWQKKDESRPTDDPRSIPCAKIEATHARVDLHCLTTRHLIECGAVLGATSHTKRVPSTITTASLAVRQAFLKGYLQADGYVQNRGDGDHGTVVHSCNPALLRDVYLLAQVNGIDGSLSKAHETDKKGHLAWNLKLHGAHMYDQLGLGETCRIRGGALAPPFEARRLLHRTSDDVSRAYEASGYSKRSAQVLYCRVRKGRSIGVNQLSRMGVNLPYNYVEVVSVEETGAVEEVYTLSVDHPDHSYVVETVVSKNSTGADCANRALLEIAEKIPFRGWSPLSGLNLQVHDAICVVVPIDRKDEALQIVGDAMTMTVNGVEIIAEPSWGTYWSEV